jgi:hypothetical protein
VILSTYLAHKLLDHVFNGVAYTAPSGVWIAIYTNDPTPADVGTEVAGYSRPAATWTSPADHLIFTDAMVSFTGITGEPDITHWGARDASTGGNLLVAQAFPETFTPPEGGTLLLPAAAFAVTAF